MNGRVYDPTIGRFMSVDPVFQFPENTQSLNPYSYVLNNPLSLTDPTGHFAFVIPLAIAAYNVYSAGDSIGEASLALKDDTATFWDKAAAVGEALTAVVDVTPGDLFKNTVKAMRQAVKATDKAAAKAGAKETGEKATKGANGADKGTSDSAAPRDSIGAQSERSNIQDNAVQGKAYADKSFAEDKQVMPNAEQEVSIVTNGEGVKIRVDCIGNCPDSGKLAVKEYKSSDTAALTPNQKAGFPDLETSGGTVVGKGKGEFPGGTKVPPTKVEVQRPVTSCLKEDSGSC